MNSEGGRLNYILGIDPSEAEAGRERGKRVFDGIAQDAAKAGASVDRSLSEAGKSVGRIASPVKVEIGRLEKAYKAAFEGMAAESSIAIKESISEQMRQIDLLRARATDVAEAIERMKPGAGQDAMRAKFKEVTESIEEEEYALKGMRAQYDIISGASTVKFRSQMMQLRNGLMRMREAGQQGTEEYKRMEAELGKLSTKMREVQAAARMNSTGASQWRGMIEGVRGLMGAYTALSGVMGIFTSDQEKLMKIQTRMQSLMSVLMGMQTVANTLHSTSTFRLRTLVAAQELYNAALARTKAALLSGSEAARVFKIALASTGVGLLVVALVALVAAFAKMRSEAKKAEEAVKKQNEEVKDARKAYAEAALAVKDYQKKIEKFNGTQEQEAALVKELNGKFGEEMGYCKSLVEWKDKLISKSKAYCDMLKEEALAQGYMNRYVEAYIEAEEAAAMYRKDGSKKNLRANNEAQAKKDKYLLEYNKHNNAAQSMRQANEFGGYKDTDSGDSQQDDKQQEKLAAKMEKAAKERRTAQEEYVKEVASFIIEGEETISQMSVDAMEEGLEKELAQIELDTRQKKAAWAKQIDEVIEARREADKKAYLSQEGNTEDSWEKDPQSKKTKSEYKNEIFYSIDTEGNAALTEAGKQFYAVMDGITQEGERQISQTREKYNAQWVQDYGTTEQKISAITAEYSQKAAEAGPEFSEAITKEMNEKIAAVKDEDFKKSIDWEGIFGDLGTQSLPTLEENLAKVKQHFEDCKGSMGTEEIKNYQEAMAKLREEIDSRNPFVAFHNSIQGIKDAKGEIVEAMQAWKDSIGEVALAQADYNLALLEEQDIKAQMDEGTGTATEEDLAKAKENTAKAQEKLNKSVDKSNKSQDNAKKKQDTLRQSYLNFNTQLGRVGGEVLKVAGNAKNLAAVFSDDVSDGMGKVIDFTGEVLDAAQGVVGALADTAKKTTTSIVTVVDATTGAVTATAAAGAASISTIEKASVILAIISAAMQVAMAIANLFNNDKGKQKQIDALQNKIDELQWEMDNANTVRLQQSMGKAVEKVRGIYHEAYAEMVSLKMSLLGVTNQWLLMYGPVSKIGGMFLTQADKAEIMRKSVEQLADEYAKLDYTADKALGGAKYDNARDQLKNLAEQQVMIQQQIELEQSKKHKDKDKIKDWQEKIAELGQKMADVINGMMEDIIGGTSDDIAKQLGDAFADAFAQGEDAAKAWSDKVNEIVRDIVKQMLVQKLLEEPLGDIFDKYKKRWFGEDGTFRGFDEVNSSMVGFAGEMNDLVTRFQEGMEGLPQEVKDIFLAGAERSAAQKGIATASQDSVDELNGRMTAVQGHTFSIAENTKILTDTAQQILRSVMNIDRETEGMGERMERMETNLRGVKSAVEDIALKGLKIK